MPDTPSITLVKRMNYRGAPEEWSNTYHFTGTTPTNDAGWQALGDAIYELERTVLRSDVVLVQIYGYEAGNEVSVAQIDRRTGTNALPAGTANVSGGFRLAGDQAIRLRARRDGNSSKGKKVYGQKYYHGSWANSSTTADEVPSSIITAMQNLGNHLLDGSLPGGCKWCAPQGQTYALPTPGPYVTTRTLKRRGKRP